LLNAGCDSFHTEVWMGHKISGTKAAYFTADFKDQREIYAKYIPYLTIEKAVDVSENPEYIKLRNNYEILKTENANNVIERFELQEMNQKLQQVEETNSKIEDMFEKLQEYSLSGLGSQVWTLDEHGNAKRANQKDFKTT
jgi:hypothetical protein